MAKILIIEDKIEVRENIAEILELSGYEIETAENGKVGVGKAIHSRPNLILCDVMMPELDGFGVLKILSNNPITTDIPFVFLTAKTDKEDLRRGMNLGADDYITKPFDDLELLQVIEMRLDKSSRLRSSFKNTATGLSGFLNEAEALSSMKSLSNASDFRTFKEGDVIFQEGQTASNVHYIESGQVKLCKYSNDGKELVVSLLRSGDFFGYPEVIQQSSFTESAIALGVSKIRIIKKDRFFGLLYGDRDVAAIFIKMLANNTTEKIDQLIKLAYNSVRRRTADALLEISRNSNSRLENLEIKREDLASIAGTAKETVIRTLSDFKDEGLVKIDGRKVSIIDKHGLERMSN